MKVRDVLDLVNSHVLITIQTTGWKCLACELNRDIPEEYKDLTVTCIHPDYNEVRMQVDVNE